VLLTPQQWKRCGSFLAHPVYSTDSVNLRFIIHGSAVLGSLQTGVCVTVCGCVGVHIHGNMATTGRLSHINFSVLSFRPVKLASSSSPWRLPAPQIWPRLTMRALQMFFLLCCIVLYCIVSEHEFTFTFAICYRPCVCLSSVTFVHSTQPEEIFGNVSTPFSTLTIH